LSRQQSVLKEKFKTKTIFYKRIYIFRALRNQKLNMVKVGDVIGEEGNANPVEDASKTTPNTTNHRVGLRKDLRTIAFLMFMYFLQGKKS
jgi:hypothetical protein